MVALSLLVAARLLVPLLIPRFPLPALVLVGAIDANDQVIFQVLGAAALAEYQTIDKALDIYYLTIAYAATIRNWGDGFAFKVGRFLWYYRLAGVTLFEATNARWLLLLFPNTFEYYFVVVEALKIGGNPFSFERRKLLAIALFIWVFVKLPQEWWLHVAQKDFSNVLKTQIFDVPVDASWGAAFGTRPSIAFTLAGGLVLLAVLLFLRGTRWFRSRAGATFSADAQARRLSWVLTTRPPSTRFDGGFVEKVVMVTLVVVIFRHILPGRHSMLQAAVGISALITTSTCISHWLVWRGLTWRSAVPSFIVLGIVNVAVGALLATVVGARGAQTSLPIFLFLISLLTLIVVLFDAFQRLRWCAPGLIAGVGRTSH